MYYSQDSLEKINAHLNRILFKKRFGFGPARKLADALFACITESADDKRSEEQKRNDLYTIINPKGINQLSDTFSGSARGALDMLLDGKAADTFRKVWERCHRCPFSTGLYRRSFRSRKNSFLYLDKNISLLQDIVYAGAFGKFDMERELTKKKELYQCDLLVAHMLAVMIDDGDSGLLDLCRNIVYGDTESGLISRELISGLLMSRSTEAHKMIGDLLLAAKLQEGLRQAVIESMDQGSREGFLYILKIIIDHDLGRFSSVIRAFDTWTGLGLPPEKSAVTKRCLEMAYLCLTEKSTIESYLESSDALQIYTALWAAAFDEVADTAPALSNLLSSPQKYKKLSALYFLHQTVVPSMQNELALTNITDNDLEVSAWCVKNLFHGCAINGYRFTPPDAAALSAGFPPAKVYQLLRGILLRLPKKEILFHESLFPWCTLTLTASEILEKMLYCIDMAKDRNLVDEMLQFREKMSVDVRHGFVKYFLKRPITEKQKIALVEALGDKSPSIRECANELLADMTPSQTDYLIIENLLQYKSGDIRKNSIKLLIGQEPGELLAAIERLSADLSENKRLGAIELVSAIKGNSRFSGVYQEAGNLLRSVKAASQAEMIRTGEVINSDRPVYTLENGFGLYDPSRRYAPALAQAGGDMGIKSIFAMPPKRVRELFTGLSELIHENREYQYETVFHDGSKSDCVFGSQFFLSPLTPILSDESRSIDNYPLSRIWISFQEKMSISDAELLALAYAHDCSAGHGFDAQDFMHQNLNIGYSHADCAAFRKFFNELPYSNHCTALINALIYKISGNIRYQLAYPAALFLFRSLPAHLHKTALKDSFNEYLYYPREKDHFFCDSVQLQFWLQTVREASAEDKAFSDYFNLAYSFYKASDYEAGTYGTFCTLETEDFGRAFEMGLIDENEMLFELMGRKSSPDHLLHLTNQILYQYKKASAYAKLTDVSRKAIRRITEIETGRGEMTTCVSHLAAKIHQCYGADTFVAILLKMEKDSYVRGYSFAGDDSTKKQMFSHLLKYCYPEPDDNADVLHNLLKGKRLSDARLVDAAIYAPQWMDIVEEYLNWPGLKSTAWYFHAHMNDSFSNEKRTIVARYSAVDPEDFKDGAFDVTWFWDAYQTIGEKRFQLVYQAAKYVASGGQHRRAQLFADAVTHKLDLKETEAVIKEKRNKDQLLAYALIPITDLSDTLHRYEFIQAYLRQAKEYGSQRQASESTAGNIALANLARNAGYQDVNRLMWQMETEKLNAAAHLFTVQSVEDVSLRLMTDSSGMAVIETVKDGKSLRDIPSRLKNNEIVQQLKAMQKDLKLQRSRAKASLENAMVTEDHFTVRELSKLEQNPVIAPLIKNLIFLSDTEHGYWKNGALVSFDGTAAALSGEEQVRLAHPHDLFKAGVWPQYQRDLFDRQIIQPFKQVFRELYRPNEDELKQLTHSNRYAGHQVQPKKTLALLKSRGWTASYEEGLQKVCYKENIIISLYALADWFAPADIEAPTIETVCFHDRKTYDTVSIEQISPVLFSEAMRDIDLVVSMAHAGGVDLEASFSTLEMREGLLSEMIRLMRLDHVEIRKTYAFIKGKLGEYTVHLGSGTVQKMATGSIFIIPVHSQHRSRLFLPFMDDDPKTAEIISKIVLLAEDAKIKDPEILRQIRQ
ncbi:MAG TPA: DUF4132 domain-containing protein [Anaerovoracaceae bacterium]|nr:DUF4132 domain-containing protein [Anaerovoracaceae bacterium]